MTSETEEGRDLVAARFPQLSSRQIAFVVEYVANGGKRKEAAIAAGYAAASAHVEAHRQLTKPNVIKAVYELTVAQMGAHLPAALARIAKLSDGAKSEYVQLEASKDLLDRAGLSAPKQVRVSGDISVSYDFG
jgi:phage terminase small subunit